jgi:thiamine-monophosphate kinase
MLRSEPRVDQWGEQKLLRLVQGFCPAEVVGDDGAILTPSPGQSLVVTTDLLVEGVHFSDRTTPPDSVGWRAAAANLSDLAAMGATPLGITVGLSLRGDCPIAWVQSLYEGMSRCCSAYESAIVGGDLCRSSVITVAITAIGQVSPDRYLRRNAAQPGDEIVVTGRHGASRAGLERLLNPSLPCPADPEDQQAWIQAHQYPRPRFDVLPVLGEVQSSGSRAIAGMDTSDGLADAVLQICRASGVGAQLDLAYLPFPPGLVTWVGEMQAIAWVLYGGEDFELVLCLPRAEAEWVCSQLGEAAKIIGKITNRSQVILQDSQGLHPPQNLSLDQAFQHFNPVRS